MKTITYRYPYCKYDGDEGWATMDVVDALSDIGSNGKILDCVWSGEYGDDAIVTFTIEEDKVDAFNFSIENYI